jgi:hypothetical protein
MKNYWPEVFKDDYLSILHIFFTQTFQTPSTEHLCDSEANNKEQVLYLLKAMS